MYRKGVKFSLPTPTLSSPPSTSPLLLPLPPSLSPPSLLPSPPFSPF